MIVKELRYELDNFEDDSEVLFFNPGEQECSPFYAILIVESVRVEKSDTKMSCVLTDSQDGVDPK